jgi:hypothetical protein
MVDQSIKKKFYPETLLYAMDILGCVKPTVAPYHGSTWANVMLPVGTGRQAWVTARSAANFFGSAQDAVRGKVNIFGPAKDILRRKVNFFCPAKDTLRRKVNIFGPAKDTLRRKVNFFGPAEDTLRRKVNFFGPAEDTLRSKVNFFGPAKLTSSRYLSKFIRHYETPQLGSWYFEIPCA